MATSEATTDYSLDDTDIIKEYKHLNNGYPKFLISDLLNAKKVYAHNQNYYKGEMYIAKDMLFKGVHIRGTITDVHPYKDKCRLVIDDISGAISCILEKNRNMEEVRGFVSFFANEHLKEGTQLGSCFEKVTYELLKAMDADLTKTRGYPYEPGDCIELVGLLSEYQSRRRIYVDNISVDASGEVVNDINYFNHVFYLYSEEYPKYSYK